MSNYNFLEQTNEKKIVFTKNMYILMSNMLKKFLIIQKYNYVIRIQLNIY